MIPCQLLASHVPTFINNWYHKITGRMSWGGRYFSVDEATFATTLVIVAAGVWGPGVFNKVSISFELSSVSDFFSFWRTRVCSHSLTHSLTHSHVCLSASRSPHALQRSMRTFHCVPL